MRIIFSNPKYTCGDIDNRLFKILLSPDCDIELADKTVEHTGAPQSLEESRSFRSWHRHRMVWHVHFDVKGLARRSESYLATSKHIQK